MRTVGLKIAVGTSEWRLMLFLWHRIKLCSSLALVIPRVLRTLTIYRLIEPKLSNRARRSYAKVVLAIRQQNTMGTCTMDIVSDTAVERQSLTGRGGEECAVDRTRMRI